MTGPSMLHRFVRAVPEDLEPGTLYVSLDYLTTSHLCACGCGAEVALPLHPTKWSVTFDGATVSMDPSIGSRTLPCRSHYWIDRGRVRWAGRMTDRDFERAMARDRRADAAWHGRDLAGTGKPEPDQADDVVGPAPETAEEGRGRASRALEWLRRRVGL